MQDNWLDMLAEKGYLVIPQALPPEHSQGLLDEWERRYKAGAHAAAQIGQGNEQHESQVVRRDRIHWLDSDDPDASIQFWFATLRQLIQDLNEGLFLAINAAECHFACYEPGSFYQKHRDRFRADNGRRLSLVFFLNKDWSEDAGGALVLYDEQDEALVLERIQPEFGTLVIFASERFPHEVLPTQRQRLSLTGWLKSIDAHKAILQGTALS